MEYLYNADYIIGIVLVALAVHILFSDLIEAKTEEIKERTRKLKIENDNSERGNAGG